MLSQSNVESSEASSEYYFDIEVKDREGNKHEVDVTKVVKAQKTSPMLTNHWLTRNAQRHEKKRK